MDRLSANFYAAEEPKRFEGKPYIDPETKEEKVSQGGFYVGKANITVGNAYRLEDISVFQMDDGAHTLRFPDFPGVDRDTNQPTRVSFVVPKSHDAYAAMVDVVIAARESERGFAFTQGNYNPQVTIHGNLVNETREDGSIIADGRYTAEIGDVCVVRGISTRPAEYKDGDETKRFVAVDIPNCLDANDKPSTYEKDGETRYNKVFTPLISRWTDKDDQQKSKNYGSLFKRLVLSERKNLREATKEKPGDLNKAVDKAKDRVNDQSRKAPAKEMEMSM